MPTKTEHSIVFQLWSPYLCWTEQALLEVLSVAAAATALGQPPSAGIRTSYPDEEIFEVAHDFLEAERLLRCYVERPTRVNELPGDFTAAMLSELVLSFPRSREAQDLSWALLGMTTRSSAMSPLLRYQELYFDLGTHYLEEGNPLALTAFTRALTHDLEYHGGHNLFQSLLDLAEAQLRVGYPPDGLALFAKLFEHSALEKRTVITDQLEMAGDAIGFVTPGLAMSQTLERLGERGNRIQMKETEPPAVDRLEGFEADVARFTQTLNDLHADGDEDFLPLWREIEPDDLELELKRPRIRETLDWSALDWAALALHSRLTPTHTQPKGRSL